MPFEAGSHHELLWGLPKAYWPTLPFPFIFLFHEYKYYSGEATFSTPTIF